MGLEKQNKKLNRKKRIFAPGSPNIENSLSNLFGPTNLININKISPILSETHPIPCVGLHAIGPAINFILFFSE